MKMVSRIFVVALLVSSCQHPLTKDQSSPYFQVPEGSRLILDQPFSIPPGKARVFIQNGQVINTKDLDQYQHHCEFEINTLKDESQIIQPDEFYIYKTDHVIRWSQIPVMYASLGMLFQSDSPLVAYTNEYYLRSQKQPDVRALSCLHWDDQADAYHLSVDEVQQVLEGLFTLHIKQE